MLSPIASAAPGASPDAVFDSVMLYTAKGVDHDLPGVPAAILRADVQWEPSFFNAVSLHKTIGTLGERFAWLGDGPLGRVRHGYEVVVAQHHGRQHNAELGAALTVRTPDLAWGGLAVNAATGVGLSHAFGTPTYEDGPVGDPDRRYRTQLLLLFDLEWKADGWDRFSIVTRIHHRSGAYGLIAPRNVGSNFLALGLRYDY